MDRFAAPDDFAAPADMHFALPPGPAELESDGRRSGDESGRVAPVPEDDKRRVSRFMELGLLCGLLIFALKALAKYRRQGDLVGVANYTAYRWGLPPVESPVSRDLERAEANADRFYRPSHNALRLPRTVIYDPRRGSRPWRARR
jgi:hypothetical protein